MSYTKFLGALALSFALIQSSFAAQLTDVSQKELATGEISGPNGESLWDYLFVNKTAPTSNGVEATAETAPTFKAEEITLIEPNTKDIAQLNSMSPELTTWQTMEPTTVNPMTPRPTSGIESMSIENTNWAPGQKDRFEKIQAITIPANSSDEDLGLDILFDE